MEQILLLGVLGFFAIEDIRKKQISVMQLLLSAGMGIGLIFWKGQNTLVGMMLGAMIGLVIIGVGILTREGIGLGDGFVFMVTGIFLGPADNVKLLFLSLLYAAIFSLGILVCKKGNRKREIPFIPFVFLGYLTIVLEAGL